MHAKTRSCCSRVVNMVIGDPEVDKPGFDPTTGSDVTYPSFPLKITEELSDRIGFNFVNFRLHEAKAIDAMVRNAILIGWDSCIAASKRRDEMGMIAERVELEDRLFGGLP